MIILVYIRDLWLGWQHCCLRCPCVSRVTHTPHTFCLTNPGQTKCSAFFLHTIHLLTILLPAIYMHVVCPAAMIFDLYAIFRMDRPIRSRHWQGILAENPHSSTTAIAQFARISHSAFLNGIFLSSIDCIDWQVNSSSTGVLHRIAHTIPIRLMRVLPSSVYSSMRPQWIIDFPIEQLSKTKNFSLHLRMARYEFVNNSHTKKNYFHFDISWIDPREWMQVRENTTERVYMDFLYSILVFVLWESERKTGGITANKWMERGLSLTGASVSTAPTRRQCCIIDMACESVIWNE